MSWRKDALFLPFFRGVKNTYEIRSLLMTYWTAVNSRVVRSAIWTFKSDDREGKEQQKATKCDTCMQKVGKTKYNISWRGRCIYTFSNSKARTLQTKAWCPLSTSKEMLVSRCFFFAFTPACWLPSNSARIQTMFVGFPFSKLAALSPTASRDTGLTSLR